MSKWNNFENRSLFGEILDKRQCLFFDAQYIAVNVRYNTTELEYPVVHTNVAVSLLLHLDVLQASVNVNVNVELLQQLLLLLVCVTSSPRGMRSIAISLSLHLAVCPSHISKNMLQTMHRGGSLWSTIALFNWPSCWKYCRLGRESWSGFLYIASVPSGHHTVKTLK